MNSPLIRPICVVAHGPSNGISEIDVTSAEPIIATSSGLAHGSTESTRLSSVTSLRRSLGKSGLIGRSITLDVRTAFSLALPSLLLNPPGIFPTEYIFSSYSTERGKKSIPSLGSLEAVTVESTTVSP